MLRYLSLYNFVCASCFFFMYVYCKEMLYTTFIYIILSEFQANHFYLHIPNNFDENIFFFLSKILWENKISFIFLINT